MSENNKRIFYRSWCYDHEYENFCYVIHDENNVPIVYDTIFIDDIMFREIESGSGVYVDCNEKCEPNIYDSFESCFDSSIEISKIIQKRSIEKYV
jgi:hypothetical protein